MKKIILFDRNPLYEKYILNDSNLKIYFIQEKTYSNYLINKISRIILYVKFFFLIKIFNIKLVVSTVYNSVFISKMINLLPNIKFLIIQHYTTFEYEQKKLNKLNLGIFCCFGESQKEINRKHNIEKYELIGSPTYSIFKSSDVKLHKRKFKLCYVSQWTPDSLKNLKNYTEPKIYNLLKLEKNLKKYLLKYDHSIVFALREENKSDEFEYFRANFKDRGLINIRNNYFDTYELMNNADVTITGWSTCAYEAFADNNKVMFNPYDSTDLQLVNNETCVINEDSFDLFEKKLNNLLQMTEDQFYEETHLDQKKIIDKNCLQNAHLRIKQIINLYS